ncbi:MAG: c-type cytochrome [Proteobacteria bacterium]|nr:c-type cytochrome [Pseudomonadota bacterium]
MTLRTIHSRQQGAVRPRVPLLVGALVLGGLGVWLLGGPGPMGFAKGDRVALSQYSAGDPTGVPQGRAGQSLVERGEYLAKAADCVVCHTARGGEPFAGGFAFTLPFGAIYSTNITPDRETGIGTYSDAQFLDAVRRGVRPDGSRLYPAMPYASYTYLTDADTLAIKAYLFSLPPVRAPARADTLSFPFNQRGLMAVWSAFFNANERFRPVAGQTAQWNRGAYLAEALEHCGECHTPRNPAYALNERRKFAGAVTGGWRAYNITADTRAGVGAWSDADLAGYLASGHAAGRGTASGPMGEIVDASLSELDPADISALVAYVRSVPAQSSADTPEVPSAPVAFSHSEGPGSGKLAGKQVFEGACAGCHGWSGQSPLSALADLTGSRAVSDPKATNVVQIVLAGGSLAPAHGGIYMPAFGRAYSDSEVASVANYVTARFGAEGSTLDAAQVGRLRAQTAQ